MDRWAVPERTTFRGGRDIPPPELVSQLAAMHSALKGLLHWYTRYSEEMDRGLLNAEATWWYYVALMLHADVLFTGERGGDSQAGATQRALRDLGLTSQLAELGHALAAPANKNRASLAKLIGRIRNELAHTNFRIADQGSLLRYMEQEDQEFAVAFNGLVQAVKDLVDELTALRRSWIMVDAKVVLESVGPHEIEAAKAADRRRRSEQSRMTRRRDPR